MPKGKWINKKTATHFTLVHRPQNDPLIHDESAPSMVLNPTQRPNAHKSSTLSALASELGSDAMSIRDNEGEAANYGVYFDDTEYDYMQHLRDLGTGAGEAVFVEAKPVANQSKGKGKMTLEESLKQLNLQNSAEDLLDKDILPNTNLQRLTYQAQQDVPDAIAGFQPDMDPRLREVLEALEDEAYVDNEEEDIFQELAKDAKEINEHEFEEAYDEFEDDGWESDHTVKASKEYRRGGDDEVPDLVDTSAGQDGEGEGPSDDWYAAYKQYQEDKKKGEKKSKGPAAPSEVQSSIWTTTTMGGRKKKRAGAMTNPSMYSMTSSALVRTDAMSIIDARFEKLEEEYNADMDELGSVSGVSAVSTVQGNVRADFDGMLDEFLENHTAAGKKRVKKGKYQSGLEQLEEIRRGLGPARIRPSFI